MITMHALGVTWIAASLLVATPIGRAIRGPVRTPLADVIPLFPPAVRRGRLPARLSPRAGLATSRSWKRFRRELRDYGWVVGLVAAVVLCVVVTLLMRDHFMTWDGLRQIPAGGAR